MATSGTEKVFAGTPSKRYPDPRIKGTANEFGLYQWSAFDAPLITGFDVGGNALPYAGFDTAEAQSVLVFTSDIPVIARGIVTDLVAALQFSSAGYNTLGTSAAKSTSGGAAPAVITQYGQVLTGYAGVGADVLVTGFPLAFVTVVPGTEGAADSAFLQIIANSPVINGVIGPLLGDFAAASAPSPIILETAAYTQAIKDNGNIYQLNSTTTQYQVVGIYESVPN